MRVYVCLPESATFGSVLASVVGGRVTVFGILDAACDTTPRDHLDELGRAIHQRYVELCLAAGDTTRTNPSLVPWSVLPPALKQSNRAQANHIGTKLATIGTAIVPAVDGGEPFAFRDGEVELLARLEHDRWLAERWKAGFDYGPVRQGRFHPDMLPWAELSDAGRCKDADAVTHIPQLLASVGYQIIRL